MLAQFTVLTRLLEPENSNIYSKMRIYDGENLKDIDPKAKSIQEYHDNAGVDEGYGRTVDALRLQDPGPRCFNFDASEVAAKSGTSAVRS